MIDKSIYPKVFLMNNFKMKTGFGFDAHAFADGRRLILGGVDIPYEKGLAGHSDADVLVHAVIDAISGVALKKDIGQLFPDTDNSYLNISSMELLRRTLELIGQKGYRVNNVDCTIAAQAPKLAGYIPEMSANLAKCMNIDEDDISIKATTTEKLGFTGRKEGIAAFAVATIFRETSG